MDKNTLKKLEPANIPIQEQIELLGQFLMENFGEEFGTVKGKGKGAIEMAVRIIIELKKENSI